MIKNLRDIVKFFNIPNKDFTVLIKSFYKSNGGRYGFELNVIDAEFLYASCIYFLENENNDNASKYNAIRIIKLTLHCKDDDFFERIFKPTLAFILEYLTHDYGNLRMETVTILSEFRFINSIKTSARYGRKTTKKIKEKEKYYYTVLIEFYFLLQEKDLEFQKVNKDSLDIFDLTRDGYLPYSGDTKDKTLKYFRKAIETLDYPYFEEKMKEYGYIES